MGAHLLSWQCLSIVKVNSFNYCWDIQRIIKRFENEKKSSPAELKVTLCTQRERPLSMFWGIDAISSDFPTFADIKAASEVDFPVAPDLFLIGWDGLGREGYTKIQVGFMHGSLLQTLKPFQFDLQFNYLNGNIGHMQKAEKCFQWSELSANVILLKTVVRHEIWQKNVLRRIFRPKKLHS